MVKRNSGEKGDENFKLRLMSRANYGAMLSEKVGIFDR
jgi:hypothetical protein